MHLDADSESIHKCDIQMLIHNVMLMECKWNFNILESQQTPETISHVSTWRRKKNTWLSLLSHTGVHYTECAQYDDAYIKMHQ